MQLRKVRLTVRKSPVIKIVSISKVSKSVVACHPAKGATKSGFRALVTVRWVGPVVQSHVVLSLVACCPEFKLHVTLIIACYYLLLSNLLQKDHRIPEKPTHRIRARNPLFLMPLLVGKPVFRPHERNKIGDSVLCIASSHAYYLLLSSCKLVTKDHSMPENQHIACLLSFVIILQTCYKRS